jgi:ATP-dependent exoDNAse (exonuclease V) alpha subunit
VPDGVSSIVACPLSADKDAINDMFIGDEPEMSFEASTLDSLRRVVTDEETLGRVDRVCAAPRCLRVSVGTPVMGVRNHSVAKRIVNGAIGVVLENMPSQRKVKVALRNGGEHYYGECTFNVELETVQKAITRKQIPLVPCYACTVHKLQGQEFKQVVVCLDGMCYFPGGMYTALSRCTSEEGLTLTSSDWKEGWDFQTFASLFKQNYRSHSKKDREKLKNWTTAGSAVGF